MCSAKGNGDTAQKEEACYETNHKRYGIYGFDVNTSNKGDN
jgi:hypothetical protein